MIEIKVTFDPKVETLAEALAPLLNNKDAIKAEVAKAKTDEIPGQMTIFDFVKPEPVQAKESAKAEEPAPAVEPAKPSVTKADVRALAVKLSKTNKDKLSEILKSFGAAKLSEVPDDKLEEFHRKLVEANA